MDQDDGPLRALYVGAVTRTRRLLDGTSLLRSWDRRALASPQGRLFHLRTLLAVHRADDLMMLDLPWWTYEARDAVETFLRSRDGDATVLEFGSGASTVWLAKRAGAVDAVEHDVGWAAVVRELLETSPGLRCSPTVHVPVVTRSDSPVVPSGAPSGGGLDFEAYVDLPASLGRTFDLVLVDGRAREEALLRSLALVAPGGMVLLDDSQRTRYDWAVARAEEMGWRVRRTRGATPCQPFPRETTLLHRAADGSG